MMLPSVPKSLGKLGDVFISALGSITGKENRLGLPKVRSACVILVDGLGSANLNYRAGHAPFLAQTLKRDGSITCAFPSTTAANITSFGTGVKPGQHGMIGHRIFDAQSQSQINLLNGLTAQQALEFQPIETVAEKAKSQNVAVYSVGPADYETSGFTAASMRGSKYVAAKTFDDRVSAAKKLLSSKEPALVYFYVPELDQRAHTYGFKSGQWVEKLEDLDSAVRSLVEGLPNNVGVLLTADHGVIDVAHERQIYLDEFPGELELLSVGGDPRVYFLYFKTEPSDSHLEQLQNWLGKSVVVARKQTVIDAGWFGSVSELAASRMPEVFLISVAEVAIYHREFANPKSFTMVGQHGSISPEELNVPLLRFASFSPRA